MDKTIFFEPTKRILARGDFTVYVFPFRLVDTDLIGYPDEISRSSHHKVTVVVSRTLASCWHFNDDQQHRVMFEYGKRHIIQKVRDGTLGESEELDLHTGNAELPCPFDPERIENPINARVRIEPTDKKLMEDSIFLQLASSIIDARDNINAIFNFLHGDKLILLTGERDLLQLFRDAKSKEDFVFRLCALANIATQLNLQCLRRLTKMADTQAKSLQLLEAYLSLNNVSKSNIADTFRNINKIRQGYPIHGDRSKGVLDAHKYFKITYPITDYSAA